MPGYDTDYTELYKGLAVVIGFFLFLVLLLLIFILISYLRKWYRLKKRPAVTVPAPNEVSSVKTSALCGIEDEKFAKKYSKVGLQNSSQPQTPSQKPMSKNMPLSSTPGELIDSKCKSVPGHHMQAHLPPHHHHQMYQEFPPPHHYTPPMHNNVITTYQIAKKDSNSSIDGRTGRSSLSTIALT